MTFFFDKRPATDEYVGDTIGFFIFSFCLVGIFLWSHPKSVQIGIVLLNHCLGVWIGEDANEPKTKGKRK